MYEDDISITPAWQALETHFDKVSTLQLNDMFKDNPNRFNDFSIKACGLMLDYSKNRITSETRALLAELAKTAHLQEHINALTSAEIINFTEKRAALHTHCRGEDKNAFGIQENLDKMRHFNDAIKSKEWRGFSGEPITDVVNVGIGGSDLGPKMVVQALTPYHEKIRCHFVSNIDATDLVETLKPLNPKTTLFIISSKSFNTIETKLNADSAKKWLLQAGATSNKVPLHFIAVTAADQKAKNFGILSENIIHLHHDIGGRYSLWSAIGLPIVLAIGMDNFMALLDGAGCMDQHFKTAPFEENMPVIMALLGIWYIDFFKANNHAIIAYDEYLQHFKAHLQQLDMESNGKHINHAGKPVNYMTGPVIWGELGCNGQHAFHQLLHQGTQWVPADFIVPINSHNPMGEHHLILVANAISQAQALMIGKTVEQARAECIASGLSETEAAMLAPHKSLMGNRPSNTLLIDKITPRCLGALIALYEHKIFTQSVIWGINPFDQWGVELGKALSKDLLSSMTGNTTAEQADSSTRGLIEHYRKHQS